MLRSLCAPVKWGSSFQFDGATFKGERAVDQDNNGTSTPAVDNE